MEINFIEKLKEKIAGNQKPNTIPLESIDYDTGNENLTYAIKFMLGNYHDEAECLESITHLMEPLDDYQIRENKVILPIIEDLLQEATWTKIWNCKKHNMEILYEKFYYMNMHIEQAKKFVEKWKPEDITVLSMAQSDDSAITQDIIDHPELIQEKYEKYKAIIEEDQYTPLDAIKMFEENWDYIYNRGVTYKALFYIINLSENHIITPCMRTDIKNLGYELGPIYEDIRIKWEEKIHS